MTKILILPIPAEARRSLLPGYRWGEARPRQDGWGSIRHPRRTVLSGRGEHP